VGVARHSQRLMTSCDRRVIVAAAAAAADDDDDDAVCGGVSGGGRHCSAAVVPRRRSLASFPAALDRRSTDGLLWTSRSGHH